MKYTITIYVTEDHIKNGSPNEPSFCPIALALQTVFPEKEINVDTFDVTIFSGDLGEDTKIINLPDSATIFIDSFDAGKPVSPFSFEIILED